MATPRGPGGREIDSDSGAPHSFLCGGEVVIDAKKMIKISSFVFFIVIAPLGFTNSPLGLC
jgi:hypothetical protein